MSDIVLLLTSNGYAQEYERVVLNKNNYLTMDECYNIAENFKENFYGKGISYHSAKSANVKTIPLYDINSKLIAYFLPTSNGEYTIVDARNNGYGVLETGNNIEKYEDKLKNSYGKQLFYIFPSMIFTSQELHEYIDKHEIENAEVLNLVKPTENSASLYRGSNEIVELSNESEFVNIDGKYYGGNQSWFDEKSLQNTGCGTVASANIANHMSNYVRGCSKLYSYNSLSKSNFKKHMYDVERYVTPTAIGVPSLRALESGFERFADSRGIDISAYWSDQPANRNTFTNYIKDGLRINSPVAYLQYFNSNQKEYDWHWMTITKYFKNMSTGEQHIAVSTWGERRSLNFNALLDGNLACGVLYFK